MINFNILNTFYSKDFNKKKSKIAIIDRNIKLTFQQIKIKSEIISKKRGYLDGLNDRVVAVFLPKSHKVIISNIAIMMSGLVFSNLDINTPKKRLNKLLSILSPCLIITTPEYEKILLSLQFSKKKIIIYDNLFKNTKKNNCKNKVYPWKNKIDNDPLCVIFTSGSTGIPKGVTLTYYGALEFFDWAQKKFKLNNKYIIGSLSPHFFDIYIFEIFFMLKSGTTLVLIPDNLATFPIKLVEYINLKKINFLFWVPSIMVNIANLNLLKYLNPYQIKLIFFAGEVFSTKHYNQWKSFLKKTKFVNLYGPIEIHVDCLFYEIDKKIANTEAIPIGYPCGNTDILILNENNHPVKDAEIGELCIRGNTLALGYWNNHESTNKSFVQNPLQEKFRDLIYRTGDLVYKNKNEPIMFVGRKDYQIKHFGYRIELGEIENEALNIKKIMNVCVTYNKEIKIITMHYESLNEIDNVYLRKQLLKFLPKYSVPSKFIWFKKLPTNPNGKIDRLKLQNISI